MRNPVADTLWCTPINAIQLGMNKDNITITLGDNHEAAAYWTSITGLQWQIMPFRDKGHTILCNMDTGHLLGLLRKLSHQFFNLVHGLLCPLDSLTARLMVRNLCGMASTMTHKTGLALHHLLDKLNFLPCLIWHWKIFSAQTTFQLLSCWHHRTLTNIRQHMIPLYLHWACYELPWNHTHERSHCLVMCKGPSQWMGQSFLQA